MGLPFCLPSVHIYTLKDAHITLKCLFINNIGY